MEYVLVTGGAGYIGSHTVRRLVGAGYSVLVVDDLSSGRGEAVRNASFEKGYIGDAARLEEVFGRYKVSAVMHFAGNIVVSESSTDPLKYYGNNVSGTITLLSAMQKFGVDKMIFSSSAAVYGSPDKTPIEESTAVKPVNPYGRTKAMIETILADCDSAHGLKYVSLRYFNAAGADPSGELGEHHNPETHLIPLILKAVFENRPVSVFGNDYPTPDGTCVRDYVHVNDIADAHILALKYLADGGESNVFNLGGGTGYSVKEVIKAAEKVVGKKIEVKFEDWRPGDPPVLVASYAKAKRMLGWEPKYRNIEEIIQTAYRSKLI